MNIITIGGGGFGAGNAPELDSYVLAQATADEPRIGFIPTATGDADPYIVRFYERFVGLDCRPSHLPLFRRTPDIATWLSQQDVIFVGGGNTKSMLATWADWGLSERLRAAADAGTVLAGVSAGAICWFEHGVTDSWAGDLKPIAGLGLLAGSCCPHYFNEEARRPTYEALVESGALPPGVAIDDGAAVHFVGGVPQRVVSAIAGRSAYRVALAGDGLETTPIPGAECLDLTGLALDS